MTNDEFLNNEKSRGHIIYRCTSCDYRGYGASTMYHEMHHKGHITYNEDWSKEKVDALKTASTRNLR